MSTRSRLTQVMAVLAIAGAAFVGLPSEAIAQHHGGHGYRGHHGYGHGYGHGYRGYGHRYGYGGYGHGYRGHGYGGYGARSSYGEVRIEVSPQKSRSEAQVYVNGTHAGTVDDFDGAFQRLRLAPGSYAIEVRLSGYHSFQRQIFVSPGDTYNVRHRMQSRAAGDREDESAGGSTAATGADSASARAPDGADRRNASESADAAYGNSSAATNLEYGAVRIDVRPDQREAQVYVDGAHAGVADDFDGRSPLYLVPGSYEFEIRLDEHATLRRRILVTPGNTYELRHRMEPVPTGGSSSR